MAIPEPISYWKFDESSGNAADSKGSNDLVNNGTTGYVAAKINNGADLDTVGTKYFNIADASQTGLDFSDTVSFAFWINFSSVIAGNNIFIFKRGSVAGQRSYSWYYDGTNLHFTWYIDGTNVGGDEVVAWSPSTAIWYHVAVTKSGTTVKFYVDGAQQGTDQSGTDGTVNNGNEPFEVGFWHVTSDGLDAIIDEMGAWNVTLSDTDISDLYNGGAGTSYPFAAAAATSRRRMLTGIGS